MSKLTCVLDPVWAIITVVEEGTMAISEQLSHLSELGSSPTHPISHNPFRDNRETLHCVQVSAN